jgi:hypothetical protein
MIYFLKLDHINSWKIKIYGNLRSEKIGIAAEGGSAIRLGTHLWNSYDNSGELNRIWSDSDPSPRLRPIPYGN